MTRRRSKSSAAKWDDIARTELVVSRLLAEADAAGIPDGLETVLDADALSGVLLAALDAVVPPARAGRARGRNAAEKNAPRNGKWLREYTAQRQAGKSNAEAIRAIQILAVKDGWPTEAGPDRTTVEDALECARKAKNPGTNPHR